MSRNMTYGFNPNKEKVPVWDEEYINNQFQKVIYKDDIAVIRGKINLTNGSGSATANYPSGYNKNNCVVVSIGVALQVETMLDFGVHNTVKTGVRLINDNVVLTCAADIGGLTGYRDYILVLMKLPTYDLTGMYKGDVNGDGKVTTEDKEIIQSYMECTGSLTDKQYKLADVNGDGNLDSADILKIVRVVNGYDEPELFTEENQG